MSRKSKEAKSSAQESALDDKSALRMSRALSDPRRVQVLRRIADPDGAMCADLRERLKMNPATLSHHMRQLELAGLIETRREGKFVSATLRRKAWKGYLAHLKQTIG